MTIAGLPRPAGRRTLAVAVGVLTVTQLIGWGSTFHVPAVLADRISAGTGLSSEVVFGGATIMLLVSAPLSPAAGRLMDRFGTRGAMVAGSCLAAAGLAVLSVAQGLALFALAWILVGASMPFALNQASSTALVQIAPGKARGAIALLLLLLGLSATIAWPVLIYLDGWLGWRGTVAACAATHLLVCAPLHFLGLPRGRPLPAVEPPLATSSATAPEPALPPVRGAFWLAAVTFSLTGVLTWGLPMHMVGILRGFGHSETASVWIGALFGPGQVLARAFEMLGGHRFGILAIGVGACATMPLALLALLLAGYWPAGAIAFAIGYGLSGGLATIVRAVAPLRLFGPAAYAVMLGRLSVPQNIAFAFAPVGFAAIREAWGAPVLVALSLGIGLVCLAAMIELRRRAAAVGIV